MKFRLLVRGTQTRGLSSRERERPWSFSFVAIREYTQPPSHLTSALPLSSALPLGEPVSKLLDSLPLEMSSSMRPYGVLCVCLCMTVCSDSHFPTAVADAARPSTSKSPSLFLLLLCFCLSVCWPLSLSLSPPYTRRHMMHTYTSGLIFIASSSSSFT